MADHTWGVFVDELRILATGSPGADWWALYLLRQPHGRVTYLAITPSGGHVHVACDSKDDAELLRETIAGSGINPKFLKTATLESCRKQAERRAEREASAAASRVAQLEADREFTEAWQWWVNNVQPDPLTDRKAAGRALREIGSPFPSFRPAVLNLYRDRLARARSNAEQDCPVTDSAWLARRA